MESLLLLAAPIVVTLATQAIKTLQAIEYSENKKTLLRSAAGVFSVVGVILASLASGESVSPLLIEESVTAVLIFVATQVPYVYGKYSGEKHLRGEA